ncbi:hypothetical protein [Streptomyces asiaticus]|uniref:hypothetical protein n=1 Tax=Streptomyces asiaticus TaxID=114695 RepID=UPI003F66946D
MQLHVLERMRIQVAELSTQDRRRLEEMDQRLEAVVRELAGLRTERELVAGMADSSDSLLGVIDRRIEMHRAGMRTTAEGGGPEATSDTNRSGARLTVADAIRALLQEREEATTKEITEHVRRVRPDVNIKNISPELTRLVQRGHLVRPCLGVYRLGGAWAADSNR